MSVTSLWAPMPTFTAVQKFRVTHPSDAGIGPEANLHDKNLAYLTIDRRSASRAKSEATLWPVAYDEVTANDDVIGIVFKANEFEHRQGNLFLHPSQFDKIVPLMGLATRTGVTLSVRESARPECYLIVRADFGTTLIAPQQ